MGNLEWISGQGVVNALKYVLSLSLSGFCGGIVGSPFDVINIRYNVIGLLHSNFYYQFPLIKFLGCRMMSNCRPNSVESELFAIYANQ